jgi:hypothetical protein
MTLNEVKTFVVGTIKQAFTNKKTLDKFDDSTGTLKYDGQKINNFPVFVADDAPVGNIIAFMGNSAPQDYLICDGTEYNIADYPLLAQHILDEFGSYNYFGGDGTATFAVPDLRGEFLRGTGTATRDAGTGSAVGEHQEPTKIPNLLVYDGTFQYTLSEDSGKGYNQPESIDKGIYDRKSSKWTATGTTDDTNYSDALKYTVRPTNTSVLYCIKYQITQNNISKDIVNYSLDEQVVGSWVNGKPVYQKSICTTITSNGAYCAYNLENFSIEHLVDLRAIVQSASWSSKSKYISGFHSKNSESHDAIFTTWISSGGDLYFYSNEDVMLNQPIHVIIEYTKTTDAENSFTPDMLSNISTLNTTASDEEVNEVIGGI